MISPQQELALLADVPDSDIDLCRAALTVSQVFQSDVEPAAELARLDLLATAARGRVPEEADLLQQVVRLNDFLFHDIGLSGNRRDFYDPRNSFLDQVLARRLGIPISLSVIYCEVAVRLGMPAYGIGFPAHFLVGVDRGGEVLLLDPYAGGVALPEAELDRRLADVYGEGTVTVRSHPSLLRPAGKREILTRMLRHLIAVYRARGEEANLLEALDAILALAPDLPEELRERGLLYRNLGYAPAALADLRRFVQLSEDAEEIAAVTPLIESLAEQPVKLH